jgi:Fic family protein
MDIHEYIEESNRIEGVINNRQAVEDSLDAWNYLSDQDELTHEIVLETHRRIMETLQPEISGMYRSGQVYVGDHVPPPAEQVKPLMDELLGWTPEMSLEALQWHVEFETIHPFADGNGRTGRMCYWWMCGQLGETPLLFRARDKQGYYSLFHRPSHGQER